MINRDILQPHRLLLLILKTGITACLGIFAFICFLAATPFGSSLILDTMLNWQCEQYAYTHIQGSFISGLKIDNLSFNNENSQFDANEVELKISPKDFVQGYFRLNKVKLTEAKLNITPSVKSINLEESELKSWLDINHLRYIPNTDIHRFNIQYGSELITIQALIFKLDTHNKRFSEFYYKGNLGSAKYNPSNQQLHWNIDTKRLCQHTDASFTSSGDILFASNTIHMTAKAKHLANVEYFELSLDGNVDKHQGRMLIQTQGVGIESFVTASLNDRLWQATSKQITVKSQDTQTIFNNAKIEVKCHLNHSEFDAYFYHHQRQQRFKGSVGVNTKLHYTANLQGTIEATALNDLKFGRFYQGIIYYKALVGSHKTIKLMINGENIEFQPQNWPNRVLFNNIHFNPIGHDIEIQGHGTVRNAPFKLHGHAQLKPIFTGHIHVNGTNIPLATEDHFNIVASPNIKLSFNNGLHLTGNIDIPTATIKTHRYITYRQHSDDVQVKQKPKQSAQPLNMPFFMDLDVNIQEGDYEGFGITAKTCGQLHITKKPESRMLAKGHLQLKNGKYKRNHQQFNLEDGQLLFDGGPIVHPILDVKAQKRITGRASEGENLMVGLHLQGKVQSPNLKVYSNQNISDTDIISYLFTNRPTSELTDPQGEVLFEAVSHLTQLVSKSDVNLKDKIQQELKLDQITIKRIRTNSAKDKQGLDDTMLIIGKEIFENFYLQYGINLGESKNQLGVTYYLSKHVSLEAYTGPAGTEADLLINFESG